MAPGHILIVDDDAEFRLALSELLGTAGYLATAVPDVEQALLELRRQAFHVVLCDLQLPGRSGLFLISELHCSYPAIAPVLISGCGSVRSAVTAMKRGAVEVLAKPIHPKRLLALLERLLAGTATSNVAAASTLPLPSSPAPLTIAIGTRMEAAEREIILRTLAAYEGNKTLTASVLGISRRSIYNKLAGYAGVG